MRTRSSYRKLGALAVALAIVAMPATTAARGGTTTPSYTCGVSVSPVTNGYGYSLIGSGYAAGMGVTVYVADSVQTFTYTGTVNSKGTFSISALAGFASCGAKTIYVNRTGDRKMVTYCTSPFLVP